MATLCPAQMSYVQEIWFGITMLGVGLALECVIDILRDRYRRNGGSH